mmetsp:Transcript_33773/g.47136  ORF Transcript_33773/g.47136 Transcript_33773/m.47136 type:complete len:461 (-) Transcript_33773:124-1506(-)
MLFFSSLPMTFLLFSTCYCNCPSQFISFITGVGGSFVTGRSVVNSVTTSYGQKQQQLLPLPTVAEQCFPLLSRCHIMAGQQSPVESENVQQPQTLRQQRGRPEPRVTLMNPWIQHVQHPIPVDKGGQSCMLKLTPLTPYSANALQLSPPRPLEGADEKGHENLADMEGYKLMVPSSSQFGTMQGQVDLQRLQTQLRNDREREAQGINMEPHLPTLICNVKEKESEENYSILHSESPCKDEAGSPVPKHNDQRIIPAQIEFGADCDSCSLKYRSKNNRSCGGNGGSNGGSRDCKAALHIIFESNDDDEETGEDINNPKEEKHMSSEKTHNHRACRSCYRGKVKCVFSHPGNGCDRCRRLDRPCIPNSSVETGGRDKRKLLSDRLNRHQGMPCKRTEGCLRPHRHPGHCRLGETRSVVRAKRRLAKVNKLKVKKKINLVKIGARAKKKRRISNSLVAVNREY